MISILDLRNDLEEVISLSLRVKRDRYSKRSEMEGRTVGLIFEKPSTRTRISLETAITQLGGHGIYLNPSDMQMGRGETVEDTAKVLSGFLDAITYRAFSHENVVKLAKHSSVPVINALDDVEHPLQVIA
ncbi:ornithine carbamoyltransferase, partial [mine drainage metagenome]